MKNKKNYLAVGALLCSVASGAVSTVANTFAEGASSFFDANATQCVIDNYNAETGSSVTSIESVNFDDVTILNCSNRNISHFRGIVLFRNLRTLDLSYNTFLGTSYLDFSQNTKLERLNLYNAGTFYNIDLSHNPDINHFEIRSADGSTPTVTFADGVKKLSDDTYGMDLNDFKWWTNDQSGSVYLYNISIDDAQYPYTFDRASNKLTFADKTKIPYSVYVTSAFGNFYARTRYGWVNYAVYFNGDEEVETHNPIYVNNNCEKMEGYYSCNNSVYAGDSIDSEEIYENIISRIFNTSDYALTRVEIVPPTANVSLTEDTENVKKGVALADANFTLEFYFELQDSSLLVPDTGSFTADNKGLIVGVTFATFSSIGVVVYLLRYVMKRQKAKVHFK